MFFTGDVNEILEHASTIGPICDCTFHDISLKWLVKLYLKKNYSLYKLAPLTNFIVEDKQVF